MSREYKIYAGHMPPRITDEAFARELFEQNTFERRGSLEEGFSYWVRGVNVVHLMRVVLCPIEPEEALGV